MPWSSGFNSALIAQRLLAMFVIERINLSGDYVIVGDPFAVLSHPASAVLTADFPGASTTVTLVGEIEVDEEGRWFKSSWGMASTRAVEQRFRRLDAFDRARKTLFAEGISSSRILLDPQRPSIDDLLDMITSGLRSSMTYAGAATLPQFHERAVVGVQSAAGYEEGKALPVSW